MILTAIVLHNVSPDRFWQFRPDTSRLFHAHTLEVTADNVDTAAELVFLLTNVDDSDHLASMRADLSTYGPQVTEYRRRRNRSTSVGDVVIFREGDRPAGVRVCASFGWDALEFEPDFVEGENDTERSMAHTADLTYFSTRA